MPKKHRDSKGYSKRKELTKAEAEENWKTLGKIINASDSVEEMIDVTNQQFDFKSIKIVGKNGFIHYVLEDDNLEKCKEFADYVNSEEWYDDLSKIVPDNIMFLPKKVFRY